MMAPETNRPGKRGDNMEFLAALVLQAQGYLVRRGVPLKYGSGGLDATDVDVLGIRFAQPFQLHRIIADCKDRQRSRPYERIFWAKGLSSFVQASETYVCLPKASSEVIKFAKDGQVRVLTEDALRSAADKARPYGFANPAIEEHLRPSLAAALKTDRRAATIFWQTKRLYLADDPYVGLNNIMLNLQSAANELTKRGSTTPALYDLWRVIAGESLVLISLSLLGIAADTLGLNKEQRAKHIAEKLTYGDLPPRKAEEIFDLAKQLAREASRASNPSLPLSAALPFDLGKVDPPDYTENIIGLVERAMLQPSLYLPLPLVMDYLVFEQAVQYGIFSEKDFGEAFPGPSLLEKLKIARNIFVFARDAAKLDLAVFWPDQQDHLPKATAAVGDC